MRAPTTQGKTYAVIQSILKYFAKGDYALIGSISPKVLIRQHGILVNKDNYQPLVHIEIDRKLVCFIYYLIVYAYVWPSKMIKLSISIIQLQEMEHLGSAMEQQNQERHQQ
jgi:hypothetical protein